VFRPNPATTGSAIAEIQGLYGAFSFPEKLLQKIWLHGDFDRARAVTVDGRPVRIAHPGKWNLLGGPDFRGARLALGDGREIEGDVELHLRAADWDAHAHARDRAYDGVVLHVVLFPPEAGRVTRGADGREIPVLALLPLLHHDLEEYAAEDAVETLANRPARRLLEDLALVPAAELEAMLRRHADARWRQKVHFARLRVQRLGWDSACHHTALEILGFRFNRAPMLRIASRWPLAAWARGDFGVEEAFAAEAGAWSLQGVRPANHPRVRLRQYEAWTRERANWPELLRALAGRLPQIDATGETRHVRRAHAFSALAQNLAAEICADAIGGTRFDNLVCDGLLPLMAAQEMRRLDGLWFHWFTGDVPSFVTLGLRQLAICGGRARPACHGFAQGILGWWIEREAQR
jgi:hypothetical protein